MLKQILVFSALVTSFSSNAHNSYDVWGNPVHHVHQSNGIDMMNQGFNSLQNTLNNIEARKERERQRQHELELQRRDYEYKQKRNNLSSYSSSQFDDLQVPSYDFDGIEYLFEDTETQNCKRTYEMANGEIVCY
ncbi:hypothetical protein ABWK96_004581 [Vibrio parahaemolyticus]|jgi:hypothetical protein|uniref:DUF4124 domain-containing protein n=1 Tax=Vibrio owensii TaxID=696485 RepID=A0AAU9Q7W0_9VIBR|nr:hypothetical protein [Vibrio parahaemolyticus]CAH1534475.1 exported hypothetical protein [Vibrio owensii]EGQ8033367.1 hypothetical protein [Vibrio parahaemolyticus]EGQ8261646.1 hypothetical protein [Vibrio parahaemolyticus]EGQ8798962.1 hypothetical protein [Vibrio parahaemolyticus]EGQ8843261.1 hypothetical protein [Vibrio parahaemolyticus]